MKTPNLNGPSLRLQFVPFNNQQIILFWVAISKGDDWWDYYGQYKIHLN